jgi:hypothetical protein
MSNNKVQLIVDDEAFSILNKLNRRDKARFVELAIKEYYSMAEVRKFFSWHDIADKELATASQFNVIASKREEQDNKANENDSTTLDKNPKVKISDKW